MKNLILFIFFSVLTNNIFCQDQSSKRLTQNDLLTISYYDTTSNEQINGDTLINYINIEFISEEEFNRNKINEENYFVRDTLNVRKEKGVISLNCSN